MPRHIGIVGAGLGGLYLAHLLTAHNIHVTLYTDQNEHEMLARPAPPSTMLWRPSRDLLRQINLDLADALSAPQTTHLQVRLGHFGGDSVGELTACLSGPAVAIDQRLVCAQWLQDLRGFNVPVITGAVTPDDLITIADRHDLTILATGKGDLSGVFPKHTAKPPLTTPQRHLTQLYMLPGDDTPDAFDTAQLFNILGVGEIIRTPFYAQHIGRCLTLLVEALPEGPLDVFQHCTCSADAFRVLQTLLPTLGTWVAEPLSRLTLASEHAYLSGAVTPTIRHSVVTLPSGRTVLGMGDAVNLMDPLVAQGGNTAIRHAQSIGSAILNQSEPFDTVWMSQTVTECERLSDAAHAMSNLFLLPPPPYFERMLNAALVNATVAQALLETFEDPLRLQPWGYDAHASDSFLAAHGMTLPA